MTAGGAGLDDEEALVVGWLEEKRCVVASNLDKTIELYSSVGSS